MSSQKQNGWCGHSLQMPILLGLALANRNFIIGTFDATVYHMTVDGTKLEKLFVEPRDAVHAISCHPYQPLIAVGSVCGIIKVWDFEKKVYLFSRTFEKGLGVQSLTYNPEGTPTLNRFHSTQRGCPSQCPLPHAQRCLGVCPSQAASLPSFLVEVLPPAYCCSLTLRMKNLFSLIVLGLLVLSGALLGAGFTEGTVYILDAMSLENETSEPFKYSRSSVSHVSFSHDSNYMATAVSSSLCSAFLFINNVGGVWGKWACIPVKL